MDRIGSSPGEEVKIPALGWPKRARLEWATLTSLAKALYDAGNVVFLEETDGGDAGGSGFDAGVGIR
jgi:hypothetical protein